jgi:hypothetical protein
MKNELANVLAASLDAIEHEGRSSQETLALRPELRDELAPLLEAARAIQSRAADFAPRPEFRRASPGRLMQRLTPRRNVWDFRQFTLQMRTVFAGRLAAPAWTILLVVALLFASTGTVYASAGALPGDALYPVKLTVEDARLFVAADDEDVLLQIEFLGRRMDEMERLAALGRENDIEQAAQAFSGSVSAAAKSLGALGGKENQPGRAALLENALLTHSERLTALLETAPEQARPGLQRALENSNRGRQVLRDLFPNGFPGQGPPGDKKPEIIPGPSHGRPENRPEPAQSPPAGAGPAEDKIPDEENNPPVPGGPPDNLPPRGPGAPGDRP